MALKYFLADPRDTRRLATDGTVRPAHECTPQYFDTPDEAYHHPAAAKLTVHKCPAAETVPGLTVGSDYMSESLMVSFGGPPVTIGGIPIDGKIKVAYGTAHE